MVARDMAKRTSQSETPADLFAERELTCARVHRLADVDRAVVDKIVRGRQGVSSSSIEKVAGALSLARPDLPAVLPERLFAAYQRVRRAVAGTAA